MGFGSNKVNYSHIFYLKNETCQHAEHSGAGVGFVSWCPVFSAGISLMLLILSRLA